MTLQSWKNFFYKMATRLRSPAVWASALALLAFMFKTWLHIEIAGWDQFVTLFMAALVAFGIVNNPDNRGEF